MQAFSRFPTDGRRASRLRDPTIRGEFFFKLTGPYFYTPTNGRQVGLLGDSTIRRGCFLAHGNLFLPLATHVLATTRAVSESTALGSLESNGSYEALMACSLLSFQAPGPSPCGLVRRRGHPWGGGTHVRGGRLLHFGLPSLRAGFRTLYFCAIEWIGYKLAQ